MTRADRIEAAAWVLLNEQRVLPAGHPLDAPLQALWDALMPDTPCAFCGHRRSEHHPGNDCTQPGGPTGTCRCDWFTCYDDDKQADALTRPPTSAEGMAGGPAADGPSSVRSAPTDYREEWHSCWYDPEPAPPSGSPETLPVDHRDGGERSPGGSDG